MINRKFIWKCLSAGTVILGVVIAAPADVINYDTYIDSYAGVPDPFIPGNQDVNYGGSASVKVVTSPGSTEYPNATSIVRGLIKLPESFWTSIGDQNVESTMVTYRIRNLNNGNVFTRTVSAYPMLLPFVAGTGFQPTTPGGTTPGTMGGTQNTPENPIGADWLTFDGVNAWSAPGAGNGVTTDYDTAHSVVGVVNTVDGITTMSWDLTALINDSGVRDDIHDFGLMIRITDDLNFPVVGESQQFISFYSYEGALAKGNPAAYYPVVSFTMVPEPAAVVFIGLSLAWFGMRRRKAGC